MKYFFIKITSTNGSGDKKETIRLYRDYFFNFGRIVGWMRFIPANGA